MRWNPFVVVSLIQFGACISSPGQSGPHRLAGITVMPDRTISLELDGSASTPLRSYFDLYVLETSSNAADWSPLTTLLRTNNSTARLLYIDFEAPRHAWRFYRTFTNHLSTPFPKPTGPYAVGTTSILLTDPSRTDRSNVAPNNSFMITLWYPAPPMPGILPAAYIEPKLAPALAGLYGTSQSVLAGFCSHARAGTSAASIEAPYPVVLYSHGFRVSRHDNTAKCVELASHGYVVVAADHADCLATVFPDGRMLTTTISSLSAALFESNVADLRFVLETLTQLNRDDPRFRGVLDMQRVGTMGWSYGGGVAAEICRTDNRVKATVLLDAYLQNAHDVAWLGIQKPFLGMYNAASAFTTLFDLATRDAVWMNIKNTEHQHFADWRAWISSPADSGRRAGVAMNGCIVSFFDKHLKNRDDHLLDDPARVYPEIIRFARK